MTVPARDRVSVLDDEAATLQFAARLAAHLPPGPAPLVLYLHGDLGAGKTTLARGMLQAMGEQGPVRSPTYALLAQYQPRGVPVLHLDLYRMRSPEELQVLGLADFLPGSRLWLIEWPERAGSRGLPPADAGLWLEPAAGGRTIRLVPHSHLGQRWIEGIYADAG